MVNENYTCMKYNEVSMETKILIAVHDEKQSKALISILSRNQKFIKGSGQIEWLTTRISSVKKNNLILLVKCHSIYLQIV